MRRSRLSFSKADARRPFKFTAPTDISLVRTYIPILAIAECAQIHPRNALISSPLSSTVFMNASPKAGFQFDSLLSFSLYNPSGGSPAYLHRLSH